jgi:cytochrome c biogenesis protein CcdA
MLRLIGLVISIGIADSINPSTIAPALFLASGERPRQRVTRFTIGVFLVYFVGGTAIALGPGQLLLSLVPHPSRVTRNVLEVTAGAAMLGAGALLWHRRERLADRVRPPEPVNESRSSALLGATITAVELPTAFPYFAAIAAIVGSGLDPLRQLFLLVLFNVCFVAPLVGIVVTVARAGDRAPALLARMRSFLVRRWPVLLAGTALLAGAFVIALGATGLATRSHGKLGHLARGVSHVLSLH